ncbi:2-polyprenyl-6-methoxyphenol hydroxylase [Citricoccus zhacaiensis]|uniref:2-polyprenyl-6-methoxyphenol hydroxylase n=1 Tax=Citricoccus zhacaiensis TaxID=489142 RepID=A0ABQ2MF16_9MICC|nr:FAD-dependent monooxygenase [Citricoccus zhacaiensis]GGO49248.1 2-polyprenyl-6-methoxyphenol hydroxylase [Citricoccus zhacaiensis]
MSAAPDHGPGRRVSTDVLVIGAGPTGLMAGAWCARLGLQSLVVDGKAGPTRESRALAVQARSLEVYRQLGLAQAVLDGATPAASVSPGFRHRTLGTVRLDRVGQQLTPFPGITIFEQSANEELLARHLRDQHRPVAWGTSFRSFVTDPRAAGPGGAVTAELDSPEGLVQVSARYVVAADGASSAVRRALGIAFEGATNRFEFYVLDAYGVTGTESGITLRASREHFMLAFPLGDDGRGGRRARLLGILRAEDPSPADPGQGAGPDSDPGNGPDHGPLASSPAAAEARDEARARASLAEEFGVRYAGTDWYSTYRVHHRVAAAFRAGRVFLAGDAAHIHSPVGAQGMNTGLQDAQNIVCTIADVLAGREPEDVLDRYESERRPVALNLVRTTDVVFGAVTSMAPLARLLRTRVFPLAAPALLRVAPRIPLGGRMFGYLSQIRIHYWMPGTEADHTGARRRHRGTVLGRRLPWVPDAGPTGPVPGGDGRGDNHEALNTAEWQVHAYGPAADRWARDLADRHREKDRAGPVRANGARADGGHVAAGDGPASYTEAGLPVLRFRAAPEAGLPDGTALLIRPDGFVAEVRDGSSAPAGRVSPR